MAIRLRLSRHALTRNSPSYSLVATRSSSRPTAQPLEQLGLYQPLPSLEPAPARSPNGAPRDPREWGARQFAPASERAPVGVKKVSWNLDRVRWWLSQGAIPSKPVERLLVQAGVLGASLFPLASARGRVPVLTRVRARLQTDTVPRPAPTGKGLVKSRQRRINEAVRAAEKGRGEVPVAQR